MRSSVSWPTLAKKVRLHKIPGTMGLWLNIVIEDFEAAREKAVKIGALKCEIVDLRREFIEELCFPAIACNAVYENVYLLGMSTYPQLCFMPLIRVQVPPSLAP